MRTTLRLTLVGAVAGAVTLVGAPGALAQQVCDYPFDCPEVIDGGTTDPVTGDTDTDGGTTGGGTAGGGTTASGAQLPMTGGETLLLGMTGIGALVGGTALVVAGRRRVANV